VHSLQSVGRTNKRKAELMQELGVNLIRVQSVKAASDHSGCMSAFENAGIYALLDFNSFTSSFDAVGFSPIHFRIFSILTVRPGYSDMDYGPI